MSGAATRIAEGGATGRIFGRSLMRAALAAVVLAFGIPTLALAAVAIPTFDSSPSISPGERMLVESDQLVYDYDHNAVSAVGNVKIYYGGYTLEAEKVTYNKSSGRLIAEGHVKLVDPTGSQIYSDRIDVTDDFRDGFVQSLRVDSADHTHFGAASAERGDDKTTFTDGSYTACEPCKQHPEKPPLWNVKATKIVVDQKAHMVYFTNAKLEFMGTPVAWVPYFSVPDPSVKRTSGILSPNFGYAEKLGFYGSLPYYWAIAPNMDVTFTPTYLTRQGFLGQVEFRHRLSNGEYAVRVAGISQSDPGAFTGGTSQTVRGGINTTGEFYLNQDWTFGWNGTLLSDRTFTRDYGVLTSDTSETISTVHLTGLRDRNFFEARASYYQILTNQASLSPTSIDVSRYNQNRQPVVGEIDSKKYADQPLFGGELSVTTNVTALNRAEDDAFTYYSSINPLVPTGPTYSAGTAGTYMRATKQVDWQRRFIGPMGQVITPFAYVRGDAFYLDGQTTAATAGSLTTDSTALRFMPAVGVDWSLPILAQTRHSTSIIEPRAQLIVRPDEMDAGELPNNDAQSLVYDVSNLFDHDKFSGYDRVEGGTRLNLGVHYNGSFDNGAVVDATFGQSFHLAGTNPYATTDIAGVGGTVLGNDLTGLGTDRSDYVAGATLDTGLGPHITANGRFDDADFAINRGEIAATAALGPVSASTSYLYLRNNPYSSTLAPASVVRGAASLNLTENWRAFGTMTYDINNATVASNSLGLAFDNDCLTFSVAYNETRAGYTDIAPSRWVTFRLQLRTLGDSSVQTNLSNKSN
jgi:LPS-assembly protein